MGWMAHRKWKEIKLQPSMLPGPAVPDSCLAYFHFRWAIHPICPVWKLDWLTSKFYTKKIFLKNFSVIFKCQSIRVQITFLGPASIMEWCYVVYFHRWNRCRPTERFKKTRDTSLSWKGQEQVSHLSLFSSLFAEADKGIWMAQSSLNVCSILSLGKWLSDMIWCTQALNSAFLEIVFFSPFLPTFLKLAWL